MGDLHGELGIVRALSQHRDEAIDDQQTVHFESHPRNISLQNPLVLLEEIVIESRPIVSTVAAHGIQCLLSPALSRDSFGMMTYLSVARLKVRSCISASN